MHNWLLPEYIEDLLPPVAWRVENLRRNILNLFRTRGYELVFPPLLEYLESLLTGTGSDLDTRTFKLVDQLSGRMMGLRADITPQVARIDAHLLNRQGVTRLCYAGAVAHTLPAGMNRSRELLQVGAELYGHVGYEADVEIQRLMLDTLALAGGDDLYLDLGHVNVFGGLIAYAQIPAEQEAALFQALQAKDTPAIHALTHGLDDATRAAFDALPRLYGGVNVLDEAFRILPSSINITEALEQLRAIANELQGNGKINIDLAELRGYHYHSGVMFSAYAGNQSGVLAQGGRYDEVGKSFGRTRPATGFSLDLREIASKFWRAPGTKGIIAPYLKNARLAEKIAQLRNSGEMVVVELPGHEENRAELGCDRILLDTRGEWEVVQLSK